MQNITVSLPVHLFLCVCMCTQYPYTTFAQHIPKQKATKEKKENPNETKYTHKLQ